MNSNLLPFYETKKINDISYFSILYDVFLKSNHVYQELGRLSNYEYEDLCGLIHHISFKKSVLNFNQCLLCQDDLEIRLTNFIKIEDVMNMAFKHYRKLFLYIEEINDKWIELIKNDKLINKCYSYTPLVFCC